MADGRIEIKHINFSYRKNHVLKDVSFEIPENTTAAILGANGSGKSTLLSILSGARKCPGAEFIFRGHELMKESVLRSDCLGYVPQTDPLIPELSVFDNLLLWYKGRRADFGAALEAPSVMMLGIEDFIKKPVKDLSGGMRKRVSIATALINEPEILILDEPASALDLCYKADIRGYLKEYKSAGHTVVISTHDEEDLDICDELYVLKEGTIELVKQDLRGSGLIAKLRR